MTKKRLKDVGASVRARLASRARERGEDFQLVLTRFVTERFLYRIAQSEHRDRFVLKGAALFTVWSGNPHRATRDVDLLGYGESSPEAVGARLGEVLATRVEDDGVRFDTSSLRVAPIRDEPEYGGVRITLNAKVAGATVRLQIDVGFGDAVTPRPELADFPTLLDFETPRLRVYPRETVVAEKLDAIVQLGIANSRMKDFYDLVILSRTFQFDGALLAAAIAATFANRATKLPSELPVGLTTTFASDTSKQEQWSAFLRKSNGEALGSLEDAIATVVRFVEAPLRAAVGPHPLAARWSPERGWLPITP